MIGPPPPQGKNNIPVKFDESDDIDLWVLRHLYKFVLYDFIQSLKLVCDHAQAGHTQRVYGRQTLMPKGCNIQSLLTMGYLHLITIIKNSIVSHFLKEKRI